MPFDAEQFAAEVVTGMGETELPVVPEGEWEAYVDRRVMPEEAQQRNGGSWFAIMRIVWAITNQEVKKETGLEKPTVRQDIFLDLNEDGSKLASTEDKLKNVPLNRLRKALGQDDPKKKWAFDMLDGSEAIVKVKHRTNKKDPTDDRLFAEVARVLPIK